MNNLTLDSLQEILVRDLKKLNDEIGMYKDEAFIWKVVPGTTNPAGNLCLHLCGNIQHYIGAVLGQSRYIRNRDNEFAAKGISKAVLLTEISNAIKAVENTIPQVKEEVLSLDYPIDVFGRPVKTLYFLIHLSAHLGYHLGQVNYHRRMVES